MNMVFSGVKEPETKKISVAEKLMVNVVTHPKCARVGIQHLFQNVFYRAGMVTRKVQDWESTGRG